MKNTKKKTNKKPRITPKTLEWITGKNGMWYADGMDVSFIIEADLDEDDVLQFYTDANLGVTIPIEIDTPLDIVFEGYPHYRSLKAAQKACQSAHDKWVRQQHQAVSKWVEP